MLILDRASENKLEELVLVSRKLNGVLRENYPGVHKIEPDRAALLWCASVGIGMGLLDMELEYFHRILSMAELSEKSAPIQVPM